MLVRQYRHPARVDALGDSGGDAPNPAKLCSKARKRELREETGYIAGRIRPIGSIWMTPGFCSEVMHFFHADDSRRASRSSTTTSGSKSDGSAIQAAWRLAADGSADAKTVLALFWLQGGGR